MLSVVKIDFIVTTALFVIAYILSVFILNISKGYLASYLGDNSVEVDRLKSTNLVDQIDFLGIVLYVFFRILIVSAVGSNNHVIYGKFRRLYTFILYFFNFVGSISIATVALLVGLLLFRNAMQSVVFSLFGFDLANRTVTIIQEISLLLPGYKSFSVIIAMLLGSIVQFNIIISMWSFIFAVFKFVGDLLIDYRIFESDTWFYVFIIIATILAVLFLVN